MTTINNLTIEQMREIVEGAPKGSGSLVISFSGKTIYTKTTERGLAYHINEDYWADNFNPELPNNLISLNDLRIAIAEHDREFKVGDL